MNTLVARATAIALSGCSLIAGSASFAMPSTDQVTEHNRIVVRTFADLFYRQRKVREAFDRFVSPKYIQHNPGTEDGREAAVKALIPLFSKPGAEFQIKRILVDGDMAAIHLLGRGDPKTKGAAVVDLYRLESGKIVEHWDVIQPIPAASKNPHPMF